MKHLLTIVFVAALGFFVGSKYYDYSPLYKPVTKATALIFPTQGNSATGKVTFTQLKNGIKVHGEISGLQAGAHGFHIHEFGNCACPDAVCAGDHYNPTGKKHGGREDLERHVGDLGNVQADENGSAQFEFIDSVISLNGPYSIIGRAIIIHAKDDDLHSQPTGDAGGRLGCGVIGIAKGE